MPDLLVYSKMERAAHLRRLAEHCDEPDKGTFNKMANGYGHETDFVVTSRVAIAESRQLIAKADNLLRHR